MLTNPAIHNDHPRGAYIDLPTLITARFAARHLHINQRRRALTNLVGAHKSPFRSRGIDFEEVRAYQAGDDLRTIDWRITARLGKPYTKQFREERERPILIVIDQRTRMFFGSRYCFKSVIACYLGALIAWSGLQQGDQIGGLIFNDTQQQAIRPRRSYRHVLLLMHALLDFNQKLSQHHASDDQQTHRLSEILVELRRIAKPGSSVFIMSDFNGFNKPSAQKSIHQLARHCEITALLTDDPLEEHLPPPGLYAISNGISKGQQRQLIDTANHQLCKRYTQAFAHQIAQLKQALGQRSIPLIRMSTHEAPLQRLLDYYGT